MKEQKYEIDFYEKIGNWDFSDINCETEKLSNWDFYEKIRENSNEKSLCLDLGTGGGEKVLQYYPKVQMIIATDLSKKMIETAKKNAKNHPEKIVKFAQMSNLEITFPNEIFDLVSARHTIIEAKQIYDVLNDDGVLVIEGIDRKDCWSLKEMFGRGQGFHDEISIAQKDYEDLKKAGFSEIQKVEIYENEYYKTKEDLLALLLKTPILDDISEFSTEAWQHTKKIENEIFDKYVKQNKTQRGIRLERVLYGIVAKK